LVSLVRRFLSDQLEYINVAKNYVEIGDFHQLIQRLIYPARGHGKTGGKGAGLFLAYQIIRAPRERMRAPGRDQDAQDLVPHL
jgi:pyruvate,water dikinase